MNSEVVQGMMPLPALSNASNDKIQRPLANFDPSVWGDYFMKLTYNERITQEWREEAALLRARVKKLLMDDFTAKQLGEKLSLIDAIQRLGIAYYFEEEIQELLQRIFKQYIADNDRNQEDYELLTTALLFRLLRQHGHNVSCDMFIKFKDGTGNFKDHLAEDIEGILSLYEATYLRVHGESILDEALAFTKTTLEAKVSHLESSLVEHVLYALRRPLRKSLPRLAARHYITFYQENHCHNDVLLKLTKLDFNILQKQHQEELQVISRWWKKLDVKKNWPYARDRLVEGYFWVLGVYYEPQYALARKFLTKVTAMSSLLDDTYDAYGTYGELQLLTEEIQRWETSVGDELPECMKILHQTMLEIYSEMEEDVAKEGKLFAICYAKEEVS